MSALSQNLHLSIRRALNIARDHHHGYATPEHLLLALTDDPEAAPALLACNVDLTKLRDDLLTSLSRVSANVLSSTTNPRPNVEFRSIIRRAVRHVHSVDHDTVTAAHALVSLFADPVAQFLQDQGVTRCDAVNYVCHGSVKHPGLAAPAKSVSMSEASARPEGKPDGRTYEVVLLDDEYTPMAFVVCVLQEVFRVPNDEAVRIMLSVDKNGTGSCGCYSRTEAEGLARQMMDRARAAQHPLRCIVRPASRSHDIIRMVARVMIMVVPRHYLPNWVERASGW
jgi:ATP-dependent Clp protease adapter protein ClpS